MSKTIMLGVFMPVASNGFLASVAAPAYQPTFAQSAEIADLAEEIGLDYLFWMGKWRGFGGRTGLWEQSLEPITLASAIASRTKRLLLIATINPVLFHPAVAAKMSATLSDISKGRFGLNIVTGNTLGEIAQMGLMPEDYAKERYNYAEEWTQIVKRLWTEPSVTFNGRFFQLTDCVSSPKPVAAPIIVNAGTSDEGLRFGARHSTFSFLGVRPAQIAQARLYASEEGREIKFFSNVFVLIRNSNEEAQAEFDRLREGLDTEAMLNAMSAFEKEGRETLEMRTSQMRSSSTIGYGTGTPVYGTPQTVAERLVDLIEKVGLDGLQFTFVNFCEDLRRFGAEVLPIFDELLAKRDMKRNRVGSSQV